MLSYSFKIFKSKIDSNDYSYYRKLQEEAFIEQESKTEIEQQCLQLRSHLTAQNHKLGTINLFLQYCNLCIIEDKECAP